MHDKCQTKWPRTLNRCKTWKALQDVEKIIDILGLARSAVPTGNTNRSSARTRACWLRRWLGLLATIETYATTGSHNH